ncbi:MAG: segregation/condensation protein A [Candidatus Gastranaerophilales bacterium]|nr:segregation/condensation protein A [Candidatus Gastranaerophilales bacterium]
MIEKNNAENFYIEEATKSLPNEFGDNVEMISVNSPSDQLDGIEILVSMAKTGKIDPWNIDIVDITDKYLIHLAESKSNNLKLTGRTLLFAAILLKLKSNILEGIDPLQMEDDQSELDYNDEWGEIEEEEATINRNNVVSLDEALQRRTSVRLNRNRVVTLKDLIRQLQFYEELDRKQSLKNTLERAKRRVRSYANLTSDDIINLAHDEYIENSVKILEENLVKIFEKEEKVELNTLTLLGMDKISAYIALLFLTVNTDFTLEQDEFYSDLYVVKEHNEEIIAETA